MNDWLSSLGVSGHNNLGRARRSLTMELAGSYIGSSRIGEFIRQTPKRGPTTQPLGSTALTINRLGFGNVGSVMCTSLRSSHPSEVSLTSSPQRLLHLKIYRIPFIQLDEITYAGDCQPQRELPFDFQ